MQERLAPRSQMWVAEGWPVCHPRALPSCKLTVPPCARFEECSAQLHNFTARRSDLYQLQDASVLWQASDSSGWRKVTTDNVILVCMQLLCQHFSDASFSAALMAVYAKRPTQRVVRSGLQGGDGCSRGGGARRDAESGSCRGSSGSRPPGAGSGAILSQT